MNNIWGGRGITMEVRPETTDWNTVNAAVGEDEYELADINLSDMLVIDVGSHIGSIGIWCASRGARAICIEPIPENLEMIERNANLNNLGLDRLEVWAGVAGPKDQELTIYYGYESNETERQHAFIGNIGGHADYKPGKTVVSPCYTLQDVIDEVGIPDIIKLDCEGGEWSWLSEPCISEVQLIVGEWHPTDGHVQHDVVEAFLDTPHTLEFSGPDAGPGGFRAYRLRPQ